MLDAGSFAPAERLPLAGWWRRWVAYGLDGFFTGVIGSLVGGVLGAMGAVPTAFLAGVVLGCAYWVYWIGHDGATIGMRILGMRVVPSDGRERVTYSDAFVRYLLMIVGAWFFMLGFLWAAWDSQRQAWHDHVAKTLVVRVE